jgi:hypothetical protein
MRKIKIKINYIYYMIMNYSLTGDRTLNSLFNMLITYIILIISVIFLLKTL